MHNLAINVCSLFFQCTDPSILYRICSLFFQRTDPSIHYRICSLFQRTDPSILCKVCFLFFNQFLPSTIIKVVISFSSPSASAVMYSTPIFSASSVVPINTMTSSPSQFITIATALQGLWVWDQCNQLLHITSVTNLELWECTHD